MVSETSSPSCTENYGKIDFDDVTTVQVTKLVMTSLRTPHFHFIIFLECIIHENGYVNNGEFNKKVQTSVSSSIRKPYFNACQLCWENIITAKVFRDKYTLIMHNFIYIIVNYEILGRRTQAKTQFGKSAA